MSKVDLVELRSLAEAATNGPWSVESIGAPGSSLAIVEHEHHRTVAMSAEEDAKYIAAANPQAIAMLVDALTRILDSAAEDVGSPDANYFDIEQELMREVAASVGYDLPGDDDH